MGAAQPVTARHVSPWLASLYGGIITAIIAIAFSFLLPMSMPFLYSIALLLLGVGPVLGYQLAAGQLGSDWKAIVGGIIGSIIPIIGQLILWPLFVWLFNRKFSFGMLFLGSLLGLILGFIVFFGIGFLMGQDPNQWVGLAWAVAWGFWGGSAAAFMTRNKETAGA
jgi:hypothetical protein